MIDNQMLQRAMLLYLALSAVLVGVWATLFPRSFSDDFPGFGRVWVGVDGPYNEHLVRDVGQLSLALAVVAVAAAVTLQVLLVRIAATAFLVNGIPHAVYHARHLDRYDSIDVVGNVVSLGALVLLPLAVLWMSRPRRRLDTAPSAD